MDVGLYLPFCLAQRLAASRCATAYSRQYLLALAPQNVPFLHYLSAYEYRIRVRYVVQRANLPRARPRHAMGGRHLGNGWLLFHCQVIIDTT